MAFLGEVRLDARTLLREVDEFHEFLRNKPRGERKHFLPFFTKHPQICTYLGFFNIGVRSPTHIATEFSLWGDFTCDLVAGSIRDKAFVCVEFEDAAENSLFQRDFGARHLRLIGLVGRRSKRRCQRVRSGSTRMALSQQHCRRSKHMDCDLRRFTRMA